MTAQEKSSMEFEANLPNQVETDEPSISPDLAIYSAVMAKLLEDPELEAAFFGIHRQPHQKLRR